MIQDIIMHFKEFNMSF